MTTIAQGPWATTSTEIDDVITWVKENPPNGVVSASDYKLAYPLNDDGNAARFAAAFSGRYRFNHDTKRWNGVIWALDNKAQVQEDGKTIAASIERDGRQIAFNATAAMNRADPDHWKQEWRKSMLAWAKQSGMEFHITKMLKLASSIRPIGVVTAELDADKVLVAFPNGYLNLKTRAFTPPIKDKLVTKCTAAPRVENARSELWDTTFARFVPDADERRDLMTALGYGWSGRGKEHMFVPYGPTKCGKSTIIGAAAAAAAALGDYAVTVGMETFASFKYAQGGGAREDLVALVGKRMVVASEATEYQRLNPAMLKRLLGGTDKLSIRANYGSQFETLPTFALWLLSNYAPKLPADDDAIWERLHVFPFEHQIPPEERDETERDKVVNPEITGSAVLWQIEEGWFRFTREQHGKLSLPTTLAATDEYKNDQDALLKFIEEHATVGDDQWCTFSAFKAVFREWLQAENIPDDYSDTRIGRWLGKHDYPDFLHPQLKKRCRRGLSVASAVW